jgi:hypothetical protein
MKIKLATGEKVDTDKMADAEAEITEAANHLFEVCRRYGKTLLARIIIDDKGYIGVTNFPDNPDQKLKDYEFLIGSLATFIEDSSNGMLQVVETGAE